MLKRSLILLTALATLASCDTSIDLMDGNPACPTQTAYNEGLTLLKAELRYPAGSKFPTYEENKPGEFEKCHFFWLFDADIQNGFGALRRKKVSMNFHYDLNSKEWISDSMWMR